MQLRTLFVYGFLLSQALTFGLSYSVSSFYGTLQHPRLYLSESINHEPSSHIGILGIGSGCILWALVAFAYYSIVAQTINNSQALTKAQKSTVNLFNEIALVLVILSCFGAAGVLAIPLRLHEFLHHVAAGVFFLPNILYMYVHGTYTDAFVLEKQPCERATRRLCLEVSVCGMGGMAVFYLLHMHLLASICELFVCAAFLVFASTFIPSMRAADERAPLLPHMQALIKPLENSSEVVLSMSQ